MNNREPTRVREQGTQVTKPKSGEARIAAIQAIVDEGQYAKVDGTMIDLFTASAIMTVYKALNHANQAAIREWPAGKIGIAVFRLLK